jgi:hypothetical protein
MAWAAEGGGASTHYFRCAWSVLGPQQSGPQPFLLCSFTTVARTDLANLYVMLMTHLHESISTCSDLIHTFDILRAHSNSYGLPTMHLLLAIKDSGRYAAITPCSY